MSKEKKDQYVIACLERESDAAIVLPAARQCAARLGKGLFVLNVSKDGDNEWITRYGLPYIGLKGDWKTAIDGLPTAFGGVLAVTALDIQAPHSSIKHPSTLLRTFADCKIAYLVVSGLWSVVCSEGASLLATDHWPQTTTITLDYRRESKEKLIWASYMVRFFGSRLIVATPDYKDAGFREKLRNNLQFTQKMYRSLGVEYTTTSIPASNLKSPDITLIENSNLHTQTSELKPPNSELLIAMTTDRRDRDLVDLIAGPPELRLLRRSKVPILFLNQRDDLYVLCD